jgi:hypothetical protein
MINRRSFITTILAAPLAALDPKTFDEINLATKGYTTTKSWRKWIQHTPESDWTHISEEVDESGNLRFIFRACQHCNAVNWHRVCSPCYNCGKPHTINVEFLGT